MNLPLAVSVGRNLLQWKESYMYFNSHEPKTRGIARLHVVACAVAYSFDTLNTLSQYTGKEVRAFKVIEIVARGTLLPLLLYRILEGRSYSPPLVAGLVKQSLNTTRLYTELETPNYYIYSANWLVASSLDLGFRIGFKDRI